VDEGGTYSVGAEDNCWNTTSTPSSSWFNGTVDYDPYWSCSLSKTDAGMYASRSLRERIQDARQKLLDGAPDFRASDVADLYSIQRIDKEDRENERSVTYGLIRQIAETNTALLGSEAFSARERAILVMIQSAISAENYSNAADWIRTYGHHVTNSDGQIEMLFSVVAIHESNLAFDDALATLHEIERHPGFTVDLEPTLAIMKDAVAVRLAESSSQGTEPKKDALLGGSSIVDGSSLNHGVLTSPTIELTAYPNPFNPSTTIRFVLPEAEHARVTIFNILGQEIQTVVDDRLSPGLHQFVFDAADLPSGVYVIQSTIGVSISSSKVILHK